MSLIFDEYGRPYVIIRDQETKSRLKGLDAQKVRCSIPLYPFHPFLPEGTGLTSPPGRKFLRTHPWTIILIPLLSP